MGISGQGARLLQHPTTRQQSTSMCNTLLFSGLQPQQSTPQNTNQTNFPAENTKPKRHSAATAKTTTKKQKKTQQTFSA
jgi:hypothetical protein